MQLQKVADPTLTLFVDEILAVGEVALLVLTLLQGFSLGHHHLLVIQSDFGVLGGVWKTKKPINKYINRNIVDMTLLTRK